jgi:hypothetical protein
MPPRHVRGIEGSRLGLDQRGPRRAQSARARKLGVHVSFVDTDLTAGLDIEKITPRTVATSALDALKRGEADAVVDDLSRDKRPAGTTSST